MRAQRHQQDTAPVDIHTARHEPQRDEREREVRGEAGQHLHNRLHKPRNARIHADHRANRHPNHRAGEREQRHAQERHHAQHERLPELAESRIAMNHQHKLHQSERTRCQHQYCEYHVKRAAACGLHVRRPTSTGPTQRAGQRVEQVADRPEQPGHHLIDM